MIIKSVSFELIYIATHQEKDYQTSVVYSSEENEDKTVSKCYCKQCEYLTILEKQVWLALFKVMAHNLSQPLVNVFFEICYRCIVNENFPSRFCQIAKRHVRDQWRSVNKHYISLSVPLKDWSNRFADSV